jgi:hypothetical protein
VGKFRALPFYNAVTYAGKAFVLIKYNPIVMYFIEIIDRLTVTDSGISLLAALVITGFFGFQYRKLSEQQKREEMLQNFLKD